MSPVIHSSHEELELQLRTLLDAAHLSETDLDARAEVGTLSPAEFDVWQTVIGLRYLLGRDSQPYQP